MSVKGKKVGFIGAGNMGEALIRGLVEPNLVPPDQILVADVSADRVPELDDVERAQEIFAAVGRAVVLDGEQMEAGRGLSGSGPAYVALVIEALADGGVKMGLDRATAMTLAT